MTRTQGPPPPAGDAALQEYLRHLRALAVARRDRGPVRSSGPAGLAAFSASAALVAMEPAGARRHLRAVPDLPPD